MLGAEIRSNHFADLSGRYARRQRLANWCTLLASSGAVASILAGLPENLGWIRLVLAFITAAISLYTVVVQNQKLAVDSSDLHARWGRFANDYQRLWDDMYYDDALKTLDSLSVREEELSKAGVTFPNNVKLMERWQDYVVAHPARQLTAA